MINRINFFILPILFLDLTFSPLSFAATTNPNSSCTLGLADKGYQEICDKCGGDATNPDKDPGHQLDSHCGVVKLGNKAIEINKYLLIAYGITSGLCLAACAVSAVPIAGAVMNAVCDISGMGTTATDLYFTIALGKEGGNIAGWLEGESNGGASFLAGAAAPVAGRAGAKLAERMAARKAARQAAQRAVVRKVMEITERKAIDGAQKAVTKKMASRIGPSCVAAFFYLAALGLKFWSFKKIGDGRDESIKEIYRMYSDLMVFLFGDTSGGDDGNNDDRITLTNNKGEGGTGSGQTPVSQVSDPENKDIIDEDGNFPGLGLSAALDRDPFGKIIKKFPKNNDIPKALEQAGINPKELIKKLSAAPNIETVISSIPNLPEDAKDTARKLNKMIENGDVRFKGLENPAATENNGIDTSSIPKELSFGNQNASVSFANSTSNTLEYKANYSEKLDPNGTDILHASWKGSIFQLLSARIQLSRHRIRQVEWSTDRNRTALGLLPLENHLTPALNHGGKGK